MKRHTCAAFGILFVLSTAAFAEEQPRKLPVLVEGPPEKAVSGVMKAITGRVVTLEDDQRFSINEETKYFKETGFDLMEANAVDLRPGVSVSAVGKPDSDGTFVAERVIVLKFLWRGPPTGPDRMEWGTSAVVEGIEKDWILLNERRKIPVGKQTKIYVTKQGQNEVADLAAVKKGMVIDFNLSGRPAVLKGREVGDVTTVWVVVWEKRR